MAWTKYITMTRGCSYVPLFQVEWGIDACGSADCIFDTLMENVYICPHHFSLHICRGDENSCLVAWNGREHYCRVSCRDLHQEQLLDENNGPMEKNEHAAYISHVFFTSGLEVAKSRRKNNDEMYTILYRKIKYAVAHTVSSLCNHMLKRKYNRAMKLLKNKKKMDIGERDVASEILMCRDVYHLAQFVLTKNKQKKERTFLIRHINSFVYHILVRYCQGLRQNCADILKSPPYAKTFLPLPKKSVAETFFHLKLTKMSKCILIVQSTFDRMCVNRPFAILK